jgi:hypothetical protein
MALFYECMLKCARKLLDTADIVREAMFRQSTRRDGKILYLDDAGCRVCNADENDKENR